MGTRPSFSEAIAIPCPELLSVRLFVKSNYILELLIALYPELLKLDAGFDRVLFGI
jgi:hypothetical protein